MVILRFLTVHKILQCMLQATSLLVSIQKVSFAGHGLGEGERRERETVESHHQPAMGVIFFNLVPAFSQ